MYGSTFLWILWKAFPSRMVLIQSLWLLIILPNTHFLRLKNPFRVVSLAALFIKEVLSLHGFPSSIVENMDRVFLSCFWRELCRLHGTKLIRGMAFHPQTDGQIKIINKALETYLRCFLVSKPKQWAKCLTWAEFCYNTAPHSSNVYPHSMHYMGSLLHI